MMSNGKRSDLGHWPKGLKIPAQRGHVIPRSSSFRSRDDPLGQYLRHAKFLGYLILRYLILGHSILRRLIL